MTPTGNTEKSSARITQLETVTGVDRAPPVAGAG